jgi:SAM-dependent methyltransferase
VVARSFVELLACPSCRGPLARAKGGALACAACDATYPVARGIVDLRKDADPRTRAVREFYTESPFPNYPPEDSLSTLRGRAAQSEFARLLDRAIPGDARIVEIGCGTGQMSLFLATADRLVVAADLTRASLELGADAARRYELDGVHFVETDLRTPGLAEGAFDVVYSSGVLHHTPDPRASFASIARLVRPGGMIVLGLYNAYARVPHRMRRAVAKMTGLRFIPFDPVLRARDAEPERRKAWLRDQYVHPEEHRHTIGEVQGWFAEAGIDYVRTYPSALIGDEPAVSDELFAPAEDNWGLENWIKQIGWAFEIGYEGGLWVTVGQRPPADLAS